jgi:putative protease
MFEVVYSDRKEGRSAEEKRTEMMELVSPAGNLEKLTYAYLFGADAAYIGILDFSLRARADNFAGDDHTKIEAIKSGKKLYCALNIYFHDDDLDRLDERAEYIARYPIDAFIVSDIGVLPFLRKHFPGVPLHLSTQANCLNTDAAAFYRDLGFKRIVLGRELSLAEIEKIKKRTGIEIEVFAHGAICLAYSGRCFLSAYMADRSANKGDCAHPCRWKYLLLEEEERKGEYFPVIEGEGYTSILSSRDLCMVRHLDRLADAGVDAIKIEGRMKSVYYTAVTTRAYRKVLDSLAGRNVGDLDGYIDELFKASHREFSTGFFFGKEEIEKPVLSNYVRSYDFLGIVGVKSGDEGWEILVKNQIRATDTIEYIGFDVISIEDSGFGLYDENGNTIEKIDHGKPCRLRTDKPIREGYIIRKKT